MMKTLADALGAYRTRVEDFHGTLAYRHEAITVSQMLANDVMMAVEDDGHARAALENLVAAARAFAGGASLTAVAMRPKPEDERLFRLLIGRLEALRDVLRTARPSTTAQFLGIGVDDTQVPDPF